MQRRTLLLFALFVITAWFYASLADDSAAVAVNTHQKQVQALQQVERTMSGAVAPMAEPAANPAADSVGDGNVDGTASGAEETTAVLDNS